MCNPPILTKRIDNAKSSIVSVVTRAIGQIPQIQEHYQPKKKAKDRRELPAVVIDFIAALPPASMFDGALFHVDELVKLIRDVNLPLPAGFMANGKRARGMDDDDGPARGNKKYRDD